MEAAAQRINSASWREKYQRNFDHAKPRPQFRIVGVGAQVLRQPSRYYDTSPGHPQNGAPSDTDISIMTLKDPQSTSEWYTIPTGPILEFSESPAVKTGSIQSVASRALKREVPVSPLSQTLKSEILSLANSCSIKSEETCYSATTSPGLTTELENFQDLTEWCHRTPKTPKMSENDELNTPVLELGEFMFTAPSTIESNDDCYGLLNVPGQNGSPELYPGADIQSNKLQEFENQIFGNESADNFNLKSETYQYSNVFIGGGAVQEKTAKNITFTNSFNHINTLYQPNTSTSQESAEVFDFVPSLSNCEVRSEEADDNLQEFVCLPVEENVADKKSLRLDFSNIWIDNKQVLSTPEVINTALSLDKGFNLLNFIADENIVVEEVSCIPSPEEDDIQSQCPSTSNDPDVEDPTYTPSEASDDDEDYEPPWKKQKTPSAIRKKIMDSESEISNASTIEPVKVARRGRPPKRNVSLSSESNPEGEVSRYRELRDKNNEASRRSRLNRKKKEIELEEEAKSLDVRNRKLKVRVQELERLVNSMRNNLMQMLMKK